MPISRCEEQDSSCPLYYSKLGCHLSVHHEYYPASNYRRSTENEFRNLPDNKQLICRALHDVLHREETPPPKPDLTFMREAIRRYRNGME
jgi:hypothetical protein